MCFTRRSAGSSFFGAHAIALIVVACLSPTYAQEWELKGSPIDVGNVPVGAALTPDGRELYIANTADNTVSVIRTASQSVIKVLRVGPNPTSLVASHDGHVYVGNDDASVSIIDTATKSVKTIPVHLTAPCGGYNNNSKGIADVALTRDGRKLYLAMIWAGLEVMDTATRTFSCVSKIPCPEGLAISREHLYVSYQCWGPDGTPAHAWLGESRAWDSLDVFHGNVARVHQCQLIPQYCGGHDTVADFDITTGQITRVFQVSEQGSNGFPNVGGRIALSSDGSQLWIGGIDACARRFYDNKGCKRVPGVAVNVLSTSDGSLVKTYGLTLEDGASRISASPTGEMFVGDGLFLKEFVSKDRSSPDEPARLPIANVGDVAFSEDGRTAYVTAMDMGRVYVLKRAAPGGGKVEDSTSLANIGLLQPASNVVLPTIVNLLMIHRSYAKCEKAPAFEGQASPENMLRKECARVAPQDLADILKDRPVVKDRSSASQLLDLQTCAKQIAADRPRRLPGETYQHPASQIYRCVASEVLAAAPSKGDARVQAIDTAMELRALEANEDFLEFRTGYLDNADQLMNLQHKPNRSEADRADISEKQKRDEEYKKQSLSFDDVTSILADPSSLQRALGTSAVVLSVFAWADKTYTILISQDEKVFQQDAYKGKALDQATLETSVNDFLFKLPKVSGKDQILQEAQDIYEMIIGTGEVANKLHALTSTNSNLKPTLVWVTEGTLRYIPLAALSPDRQHYLLEDFSTVVLTRPSFPPTGTRESQQWEAMVAEYARAHQQISSQVSHLFSEAQQESGKMPAKIWLRGFTSAQLSKALMQLQNDIDKNHLVFIATHFNLASSEESSFLETQEEGGVGVSLKDLSHEEKYPFNSVSVVTFAACKTAQKSSDMEGLAYHLDNRGNGAHTVLATLWEVAPPELTPILERFDYELQRGTPKAEALRLAELAASQKEPKPNPSVWTAFILIGDWH